MKRKGRNPQTGESIEIKARVVIKFYSSKNLREEIANRSSDWLPTLKVFNV